jgi:UDP-N-acetylmuramate: L-alanyl-gamma-D-glutamyl-meso-diaminopimelate ligase
VEFDHADIYADLDAIRLAFRRLVLLLPRRGLLLVGADSPEAYALAAGARCRVESFGLAADADWHAYDLTVTATGTAFKVRRGRDAFGAFEMPLLGAHNVRNALAALAVGAFCGLDASELAAGLGLFRGVKRRLEVRGSAGGVTVYDDFAHHPTAVAETLGALRLARPGARIWALFEPRSATSCRRIFQADFARAFDAADEVVISGVFRSTLPEEERLSVEQLVGDLRAAGRRARHVASVADIVQLVAAEARPGDLVVAMSNGAFDNVHTRLLAALERS